MYSFLEHTINKPGHRFHNCTIPNVPRRIRDDPEAERVLNFKAFRQFLCDLDPYERIDGDIDQSLAVELYYHFLLKYFPNNPQIAVLRRRYSASYGINGTKSDFIIDDESSLIWPPSSQGNHDEGDEMDVQAGHTTGSLPFLRDEDSPTKRDFIGEVRSLVDESLSPKASQHISKFDEVDAQKQEIHLKVKSVDSSVNCFDDARHHMAVDCPAQIKQEFNEMDRLSRLKRKSDSHDSLVETDYIGTPRTSKKIKSESSSSIEDLCS
jgi:hypothetical protein